MARLQKTMPITHEELQAALRRFQKAGGILRKLPDQPTREQQSVAVGEGFQEPRADSKN